MAKLLSAPLAATLRERMKAKRQLHALPPPVGPDRSLVEGVNGAGVEPMAKKVRLRKTYSEDFKAEVVARALKAKETGSETWTDIAKDKGMHLSNIAFWIKRAKEEGGNASNGGSAPKAKSDIKSISRELAEAMSQVEVLKKRLRKLLGD